MLYYKSITLTKGKKMRVSNMTSNKGNKIANQFVIDTDEGIYFQSYKDFYK